jgi:putative acetyltransferase
MLVRREVAADIPAVRDVHAAAFAGDTEPGTLPVEVPLLDALRADPGWLPALSMVAERDGRIAGHVVCTRADINGRPALGLGPLGVLPDPTWGAHFQARPLAAYTPDLRGPFTYAAPFAAL